VEREIEGRAFLFETQSLDPRKGRAEHPRLPAAAATVEIAPDHLADAEFEIEWAVLLARDASVAQHDETIGDPLDIAHAVRDVEHADAARAEAIDYAKQDGGFARCKARGGLVQ